MQASYASVKGSFGVGVQNQERVLLGFGEVRNRGSSGLRKLCMTDRSTCCSELSLSSVAMAAKFAGVRMGVNGVFGSSAKPRSVKAQATDEDVEDLVPARPHGKSSGTVWPYVGVACLGFWTGIGVYRTVPSLQMELISTVAEAVLFRSIYVSYPFPKDDRGFQI